MQKQQHYYLKKKQEERFKKFCEQIMLMSMLNGLYFNYGFSFRLKVPSEEKGGFLVKIPRTWKMSLKNSFSTFCKWILLKTIVVDHWKGLTHCLVDLPDSNNTRCYQGNLGLISINKTNTKIFQGFWKNSLMWITHVKGINLMKLRFGAKVSVVLE